MQSASRPARLAGSLANAGFGPPAKSGRSYRSPATSKNLRQRAASDPWPVGASRSRDRSSSSFGPGNRGFALDGFDSADRFASFAGPFETAAEPTLAARRSGRLAAASLAANSFNRGPTAGYTPTRRNCVVRSEVMSSRTREAGSPPFSYIRLLRKTFGIPEISERFVGSGRHYYHYFSCI